MAETRAAPASRPPRTRSAVTNGRRLFVVGDLGGEDTLSEAQRSLVRRASAIECELEQLEGKLSCGD